MTKRGRGTLPGPSCRCPFDLCWACPLQRKDAQKVMETAKIEGPILTAFQPPFWEPSSLPLIRCAARVSRPSPPRFSTQVIAPWAESENRNRRKSGRGQFRGKARPPWPAIARRVRPFPRGGARSAPAQVFPVTVLLSAPALSLPTIYGWWIHSLTSLFPNIAHTMTCGPPQP